ncbi:MarR family transcriptional regulator [Allorhizocola rhizosphaerae]|uniref:arsenate reductase/protein-tyrosine-phosphatase family protein n=1 Tax=Allorhizocola rhizosphaerae TaxID=1872709 RepID=UPI000E3EE4D8|nr:MarR family transcriptional regulator [Allorhizocola rhizosphaerae]
MNAELKEREWRARIHAALGDPARLAIADALAVGDASPGEIAAMLGMTTNLVAHHVNVLAQAGVIERSRSEADRRRTYLRLRPHALSALHRPALRDVRRLVFVCTRNSARSQLAAALWTSSHQLPATCAGTRPARRVHPRAVRIAKRHGLPLDPNRTAHISEVTAPGDLIIAVCDHAHEHLPAELARLHWSVPDPVPTNTDHAFETAYADLAQRIGLLAPALSKSEDNPQ